MFDMAFNEKVKLGLNTKLVKPLLFKKAHACEKLPFAGQLL